MNLSEMVKRLALCGLHEQEVSQLLGVTVKTIKNIKTGYVKDLSYKLGKRIEDLYFCFFSDGNLGLQKLYGM